MHNAYYAITIWVGTRCTDVDICIIQYFAHWDLSAVRGPFNCALERLTYIICSTKLYNMAVVQWKRKVLKAVQ